MVLAIFFWFAKGTRASERAELLTETDLPQLNQKTVGGGKMIIGSDFMSGLTIHASNART